MQTPASIKRYWIIILTLLLFNRRLIYFSYSNNKNQFNNKKDILKLVHSVNNNNSFSKNNFKSLANGVFQAEGHIGGYFLKSKSINFRPIVFIGLIANEETIKFLVILNNELHSKMQYSIEKLPSHSYFLKLYSRDWDFILNTFIPYFNEVHGDKYFGLKRLEKIYSLLSEYKLNNKDEIIEKIVVLAYNLIDNSKRKMDDFLFIWNIKTKLTIDFFKIDINSNTINNYFLLGLILGDGYIYVRIRESKGLPWFIPFIKIGQKITNNNWLFLNNIKKILEDQNIGVKVQKQGHLYVLIIESINNVEKLINWLPNEYKWWFWKKEKFILFRKSLLLMKEKIKYWQEAKIILLNLIYKINKYNKSMDYWLDIINNYYYKSNNRGYISISKDQAWSVKLPISIKPKVKYFFFKTYGTREKALLEAIEYRNQKLNEWLIENNFK